MPHPPPDVVGASSNRKHRRRIQIDLRAASASWYPKRRHHAAESAHSNRLDFVVHPASRWVGGEYLVELAQFGIVLSNDLPVDDARYPLRAQKSRCNPASVSADCGRALSGADGAAAASACVAGTGAGAGAGAGKDIVVGTACSAGGGTATVVVLMVAAAASGACVGPTLSGTSVALASGFSSNGSARLGSGRLITGSGCG